ncbi:MAG TPA: Rieske (2Fe-2S) protein [Chloroflexota bacterium]|nr:Rieske (2Fe-2S) protein [Chloroflexota bacterium]
MTPESELTPRQVEAADQYVEALLSDSKPVGSKHLRGEGASALHMAAFLASASSAQGQPSAAFVEELRARLVPPAERGPFRLSRRSLFRGFAGGFAALAVCLFGEQAFQRLRGQPVPNGWVPIAEAADLPPGTVKSFDAAGQQGNLLNIGGSLWALSAECTHQACTLQWQAGQQRFLCPCHGALFDPQGQQADAESYGYTLRPLSRIPVQELDGTIYLVS